MNRWFALILFFPISLLSVLSLTMISYQEKCYEEFIQLKLNAVMNRANDSALYTVQMSNTLNNSENIEVNPNDMWDTYKTIFLSSFQIYDDYHSDMFEAYTPAVLIASNNGYYMKFRYEDEGNTGYNFSQKLPYCILYNNDGSEYIISATINRKNEYVLNPSSSPSLELYENGFKSISNIKVLEEVNNYLIRGIQTMMNSSFIVSKQQFSIPVQMTEEARDTVVNFKGISMIVLVHNFDLFTKKPISHFTVSNTQMTLSSKIFCYDVNGKQYYTSIKVIKDNWTLKKVVNDCYIAAQLGYSPHPEYFN